MINQISHDLNDTKPGLNKNLKEFSEIISTDCTTQDIYEQICSIIPEEFIIKQVQYPGSQAIGFERKCTRWKLDSLVHKEIIEKLKQFAVDNKLTGHQLFFNPYFDSYIIRSIYKYNNTGN